MNQAQLFVDVLGASNHSYVDAVPSQELLHRIAAHVQLFEYLGGVPEILVPDNLRSGVTRAHRYEPEVNPTYLEMAAHYGCAVIPARPNHPLATARSPWVTASSKPVQQAIHAARRTSPLSTRRR